MYLYAIVSVLLGLAIGSFLNVVIFRADDLKSILNTRSKCRSCQKEIKWYDLIPLLSYVVLKGRCRNCGNKLSVQYPVVEAVTAILFLVLFLFFGLTWQTAIYMVIFSLLIVIFVYDLKTQYILDIFSWPLLILCIIAGIVLGQFSLSDLVLGIIIGGGILGLLVVVSKEKWMGVGDIIIGAAIGALLGYQKALVFIFFAFVLGSLVGIILIALKKKGIKDAVPFAPFLIVSALISLLWGQQIIDWYLGKIFLY